MIDFHLKVSTCRDRGALLANKPGWSVRSRSRNCRSAVQRAHLSYVPVWVWSAATCASCCFPRPRLQAVAQQLRQLRTALAVAVALNRTIIMPRVSRLVCLQVRWSAAGFMQQQVHVGSLSQVSGGPGL